MGDVVGGLFGGDKADAAGKASDAQVEAAQNAMGYIQKLLNPFVNTGKKALTAEGDILGLNGAGSEQMAIDSAANSPFFKDLLARGNDNILQNASATGGLRGGNTQAALAQFSPALLQQFIQQKFNNLGGLTQTGAQVGNTLGGTVSNLFGQAGAAQAGGIIAQGNQSSDMLSGVGKIAGIAAAFGF